MVKKILLKDFDGNELLPITRGELILDPSGKMALRSTLYLATSTLPGLMSPEDRCKIDNMSASSVAHDLVLKIKSGTVEGTDLYTFNGSADKILDFQQGSGITLLPEANKMTISNSGVRAISESNVNGTISVNTNGTVANVSIKGLGSAAFTASSVYSVRLQLINEDLNNIITPGFYNAGSGNSVTNKPSNIDNFGLIVIHSATDSHYILLLFIGEVVWRRHCISGEWSVWKKDECYNVVSSTSNGLTPMIGTESASTIGSQSNEWVLASTSGATPTWRKLPSNAFNNTTYTLSGALSAGGFTTTLTSSTGSTSTSTVPIMGGATSSASGSVGLVPAPSSNTAFLRGDGTWTTPLDTHYTTHLYIGATNSASNSSTTNGNTYIKLFDNSTLRHLYKITGGGVTTVNSDSDGNLTISSSVKWSDISDKPSTFTPSTHNHPSSQITSLTGYSKATSPSNLSTTDTLNSALGKLEYKSNLTYDWYLSITQEDTDDIINKWGEIVDFIDSVAEGTDITDEFVTRKTALTIIGKKTFSNGLAITSADSNNLMPYFLGIDAFADGGTVKYITASQVANAIGALTLHQSLANYVTLNTAQTITGAKTFSNNLTLTGNLWFGAGNTDKYITFTSATTGTDASHSWRIGYIGTGSGDGNHFVLLSTKNTTNTWSTALSITNEGHVASFTGQVIANKFITNGGTSSQFVKGDGSLDSNTYATTTLLGNYLPLSGGTISGTLHIKRDASAIHYLSTNGTDLGWLGFSGKNVPFVWMADGVTGYTLLHSGNYNSYSPTLTGGGASGTWGINITGNADLLDGLHGSWYLKNVLAFKVTNGTSENGGYDLNTLTNGMVWNYSSGGYWGNSPSGMSYGQVLNLKNSTYYALSALLAWDVNHASTTDTTRNLWWRASDDGTFTEAQWHRIAFVDDIPTVTNYYWANVPVSATSNSGTNPTFGGATINGKLTINNSSSAAELITLTTTNSSYNCISYQPPSSSGYSWSVGITDNGYYLWNAKKRDYVFDVDNDGNINIAGTTTAKGSIYTVQPSANRRVGIIGSYDPNRAAAIWSMGSNYQIAADGTTLGNLYGAAYVYYGSGYTFGAGKSGGHSFVWAQNGNPTVALGDYVWAANGFIKNGSSDSYVLLGGGGHKTIASFQTTYDGRYVKKAGDTMTGTLTMNTGTGILMKYTSSSTTGDVWIYPNGASSYGIRYFEGTPDKMAISASGNNDSTSKADLCINGNGDGTVTIRGNNIWHAGNSNLYTVPWAVSLLHVGAYNKYIGTDSGVNDIWVRCGDIYMLNCNEAESCVRRGTNAAHITLGSSSYPWKGLYSGTGNFSGTITSHNYHQVYNSGSYTKVSADVTGAIVIQLPITSSQYDMVNMEIAVYEYNSQAASKIIIGGHPYKGAWYRYSCSIIGGYNNGVRLGIYGDKFCVILGTSSTVWQYPGVFVTHIGTVYDTYSSAYANKCSCSLVTSESGFSGLVTPTNVVKATYATSAGRATSVGDGGMIMYPQKNNEINFGGSNGADALYFGYRATDSKPIPSNFIFGGSKGTATLTAAKLHSNGILYLNGVSGVYLQYNGADASSLVLSSTYFKPFDTANNKLSLGYSSARWSNVYSYFGNFADTVHIYSSSPGNYTEGIRLYGTAKDSTWSIINFGCDPAATSGTHANQWLFGRDSDNRLVFRNNATDLMYLTTTGLGIGVVPTQKLQVNGNAIATNLGINSTAGSGQGISLYGGSGYVTTYGIMFATTGNYGTHGYVSGDWATYFTMSDTENRGWIFRRSGSGNVFSIDCDGHAYANGLVNASRFSSRAATGTQPYACTSTTCNTNLNADLLDGKHASAFALLGSPNNLIHAGNEFTFVSGGYDGSVWFNYRTASGTTDGNIIEYLFGDGKGGYLAYITNGYFSGKAETATTASKLGSSTVGGTYQPIYLSSGTATAGTSYAKAIKAITRSGTTFTYTCLDGTTGTFTLLDNNTTYNFSGVSFTSGSSNTGTHDCNSITSNGVWYYTANGPTTTLGASTTDGALYSQAYSSSWVAQIAQDYRDGDLFTRGRKNGTWTAWKRVAYFSEITKANVGLGNVQNTAFYKRATTVNGTVWDLAGTNSSAAFTIYAPTTVGTDGYVLQSNGSGAPSWVALSTLSVSYSSSTGALGRADVGSATQPIYLDSGAPKACTSYANASVNYANSAAVASKVSGTLKFVGSGDFVASTYNGSGNVSVNIPTSTSHLTNDNNFVHRSDSTSAVGGLARPVYVTSAGLVYACSYSLAANVNSGVASKLAYYSDAGNIDDYASSVGNATKPMYLSAGIPTACTYSLSATVNSGTSGKLACYSGTNAISSYTSDVGNSYTPVYIKAGVPTAISITASTSTLYVLGTITGGTIYKGGTSTATGVHITSGSVLNAPGGFYETSDARLKNFISDINIDFDKLRAIPKKYFTWKNKNKVNIGTSALELLKIYPEIVNEGEDGILTVAYDKLSIIALKAIDLLYDEILKLRLRIKTLEENK